MSEEQSKEGSNKPSSHKAGNLSPATLVFPTVEDWFAARQSRGGFLTKPTIACLSDASQTNKTSLADDQTNSSFSDDVNQDKYPWDTAPMEFTLDMSFLTSSFPDGMNLSQDCKKWLMQIGVGNCEDFASSSMLHSVYTLMNCLSIERYFELQVDIRIFLAFGQICRQQGLRNTPSIATKHMWIPYLVTILKQDSSIQVYEMAEALVLSSILRTQLNPGSQPTLGKEEFKVMMEDGIANKMDMHIMQPRKTEVVMAADHYIQKLAGIPRLPSNCTWLPNLVWTDKHGGSWQIPEDAENGGIIGMTIGSSKKERDDASSIPSHHQSNACLSQEERGITREGRGSRTSKERNNSNGNISGSNFGKKGTPSRHGKEHFATTENAKPRGVPTNRQDSVPTANRLSQFILAQTVISVSDLAWDGTKAGFRNYKVQVEQFFGTNYLSFLFNRKFQELYVQEKPMGSEFMDIACLPQCFLTAEANMGKEMVHLYETIHQTAGQSKVAKKFLRKYQQTQDGLMVWIELVASMDNYAISENRKQVFEGLTKVFHEQHNFIGPNRYWGAIQDAHWLSNTFTEKQKIQVLFNNLKLSHDDYMIKGCRKSCTTFQECVDYLSKME